MKSLILIIVTRHVMCYNPDMIKSFANNETEVLFSGAGVKRIQPDLVKRARRKLFAIDAARAIEDLRMPPGNGLHKLIGDREGQFSVSVNDQWRICFAFEDGNAYNVELCDYH